MAATREKTISYRRAEWFVDGPAVATLEEYLQRAHRKLKTVAERTYKRESGQCIRSVKKQSPHGGGIFIHITADTPGEEASECGSSWSGSRCQNGGSTAGRGIHGW